MILKSYRYFYALNGVDKRIILHENHLANPQEKYAAKAFYERVSVRCIVGTGSVSENSCKSGQMGFTPTDPLTITTAGGSRSIAAKYLAGSLFRTSHS